MTLVQNAKQTVRLDPARLNDREREALFLLAEGHTVKSIAALTGCSVAAINERLRQARRKTGIGSSRELARLLKSQENRDEQMGMACQRGSSASSPSKAAAPVRPGWLRKGALGMGTLAVALGIAAAFVIQQQPDFPPGPPASPSDRDPVTPGSGDPLLQALMGNAERHPSHLYGDLRREPRDASWAAGSEAALSRHYAPLSTSGRIVDLRIICAATICEVAGALAGTDQQVGETVQLLQDPPSQLESAGNSLIRQGVAFGSTPEEPNRGVFAAYWLRSGGEETVPGP